MLNLQNNIHLIKQRIHQAACKQGLSTEEITLLGVTKTIPVTLINQAIELGIHHIGENRIQEARQKFPEISSNTTRHFIGNLQRNKVKYAVKLFDIIQSIDNIALAEEVNARCAKLNRHMNVLIEVNTSGEMTKSGCNPKEVSTLLKAIDRLPNIIIKGFMTIALYDEDIEKVRPCFKLLKGIFEEACSLPLKNAKLDTLSMGMSNDFEIAIEEGSNMIRIGRAIFGERSS